MATRTLLPGIAEELNGMAVLFDSFATASGREAEDADTPDWYIRELAGTRTTWHAAADHIRRFATTLTTESDNS